MKAYEFNENKDKKYLEKFSFTRQYFFLLLERLYKIFINDKDGRVDFIVKSIVDNKPRKILEIGSGTLPIYQFLPDEIKKNCEYNICEINKKKVEYLINKYSSSTNFLKIKCSNVFPLPYKDSNFDFVLSKGVFHHIDDANPEKRKEKKIAFLNEVKRVLKNRGTNLLMDFSPERKLKDIFWHKMYNLILLEGDYNYLSKIEAKKFFELVAYKNIQLHDIETFKGLYYSIIAKNEK